MTTLITGGMGFIGLHTARAFLDAGEDVVITHFQTWREPSFIKAEYHKRVQIEKVDVTDRDGLMALGKKYQIDRIAHLAVPGLGALGPVHDLRTNITGLTHVLEAALAWGVRRLTLASSVAVYAGLPEGPFVEDALLPIASGNPTETFKKAWEILALHFAARTGLEIIAMRIGGIWGPLYHSMANLPSRLTHAAVKGIDPALASSRGGVPFAEDSGDMCYVKDCAQGIGLLTLTEKLPHNIYNVGSGRATTNGELLAAVKQAMPTCTLELKAGRSPRWRQDVYMDISRIKADTGYEPRYTVETGVRDYVAWLRAGNAQ
jgi:UDP-glucose 4-epimerase